MRADEPQEINTGEIKIKFRGQVHHMDLLILRMLIEDVEKKFPLKREGDTLHPNNEFLRGLATQLGQDFEIDGVTPTAAYEIWMQSAKAFQDLKKNTD